jgi:molybdate transport system permease protein
MRHKAVDRTWLEGGALWSAALTGLAFLALPIAALGLRAIQTRAWESGGLDDALFAALWLSAFTTALTVALTAALGTPLAYVLSRRQFRFKRLVNLLVELPIVLPPAVAGLALLVTFGRRGLFGPTLTALEINLPFSTAAVVLAQAFVAAPFYIRAAQLGFSAVPAEIEEAARVDGAGGPTLFRHITLPLTGRALTAGLILCWARALGEFGATILFAGSLQGRTQTLPLLIYNAFERDLDTAIWAGLLLVGCALLALFIAGLLARTSDDDASA